MLSVLLMWHTSVRHVGQLFCCFLTHWRTHFKQNTCPCGRQQKKKKERTTIRITAHIARNRCLCLSEMECRW